jgi:hypothetical protein
MSRSLHNRSAVVCIHPDLYRDPAYSRLDDSDADSKRWCRNHLEHWWRCSVCSISTLTDLAE